MRTCVTHVARFNQLQLHHAVGGTPEVQGVTMDSPSRPEVNVREVFQEISDNISQHGYRPRSQDMVAFRECVLELAKWPALELTAGGVGGWLLGSVYGRRFPAACIGMFICYGQVDRRPSEEFCLHQIIALPTPLGAEATAIVRGKDENSPHLRFLSELGAQSDRIAKSSKSSISDQPNLPQQAATTPPLQKQYPHSNADAAVSQDTASQQPTEASADLKLQAEDRRRTRQEAYWARKETRKQQHQGELLSDIDHDKIFRESPR